jgi:pimeloyl-ACP methyl ester carboxylesterase
VQATLDAQERFVTGSVTSKDGTTIGYRRIGTGPGIVALHGAMEHSGSHTQLAEALADRFTVYLPDRRGRGMSGPYGPSSAVHAEVDDMDALLAQTGARYVFGVSSGAIVWLHAARVLPAIQRAAIFEPPLAIDRATSLPLMQRFDAEIARGDVAAALITGMKAAQLGPPLFDVIPRWVLERMTRAMLAAEERKAAPGAVTVRSLAPMLHYDFELVLESQGTLERFGDIRADVLLLGGSQSPAFLKASLDALERVLPGAERRELAGTGHSASGNADDPMTGKGAQPERVAQELRRFFA